MDIVDGYKGIMDLDLTDVREEFKKDLTIQHQMSKKKSGRT